MAKIELLESWAGVAGLLHALMAEVERDAHAGGTAPPRLAAVSVPWAQVSTRSARWRALELLTRKHRGDSFIGSRTSGPRRCK